MSLNMSAVAFAGLSDFFFSLSLLSVAFAA